ncbi:energy transducer TonB [Solimonas marina]|uniref:Protein TonB n=1 Tax=Solimonas marina TaxID=2714601 RepID=A0A969WB85_9GAMM|nr:energy transducer TonB [Solimonas marina]NKF23787.1 TonB family protein [Solimonas marina]
MAAMRLATVMQDARWSRFVVPPLLGLLVATLLFWWMYHLIRPASHGGPGPKLIDQVAVVPPPAQDDTPPEQAIANAPPPPPDAPPSLARPDLPSLSAAAMPTAPLDVGPVSVPVTLGGSGLSLTGATGFAGFAGKGSGGGGGGGGGGDGFGTGQGFKGKPLVPLSTARPQMPEWACKQKIRGWVEVVFTVLPNGHVTNVKLVDASPRGVFEAAAIDSISNWIYEATQQTREVKQRVEMNPEDCVYNWQQ